MYGLDSDESRIHSQHNYLSLHQQDQILGPHSLLTSRC